MNLRFLVPLALTEVFELCGAYALGLRKKALLLVVLVNALTNPLLNLVIALLGPGLPGNGLKLLTYGILEPLVILAEGRIYQSCLEESHPYRISVILNMGSILGGLLWNWLWSL